MSEPTASIDDLLGAPEETFRPRRRPRSARRWWIRAVLLAAAGTAVIIFGLYLFGLGLSAVVVFAGLLALQLLIRVIQQVSPAPETGAVPEVGLALEHSPDLDERDALRSSINRWEVRLSWAKGNPERFNRSSWPRIGEIVDERLRQRHGLTRASDPERARALLGEAVWSFLGSPPKRTPTPQDFAAIIAKMENL